MNKIYRVYNNLVKWSEITRCRNIKTAFDSVDQFISTWIIVEHDIETDTDTTWWTITSEESYLKLRNELLEENNKVIRRVK